MGLGSFLRDWRGDPDVLHDTVFNVRVGKQNKNSLEVSLPAMSRHARQEKHIALGVVQLFANIDLYSFRSSLDLWKKRSDKLQRFHSNVAKRRIQTKLLFDPGSHAFRNLLPGFIIPIRACNLNIP